MLTRIDHIGIACFDLDKTVEFYRATYGFEVFHSEVNEEQGVREAMLKINETSDGGASYLQLLEPDPRGLHRRRSGWPRTARASTTSLSARRTWTRTPPTSATRAYACCTTSRARGSMGSRITFLHPKDCHGVLTELVTSAPVESPEH